MTYREPHEALCHYQDKMGSDLGAAYYAMISKTMELHDAWDDFQTLYGTSKETVEFLNQTTAVGFFGRHQRILRRDIMMQIARLLDPVATKIKKKTIENLSLKNLVNFVSHTPTKERVRDQLCKIETKGADVLSWRNLIGAHNDKDYAIGSAKARILPFIEYDALKVLIELIDEMMDTIASHYLETQIGYRSPGCAKSLLNLLRIADPNKQKAHQ